MLMMPFQILGLWLRGLLAVALIALGGTLLYAWYANRHTLVVETVEEPRPDGATERVTSQKLVEWQFGFNRETAYLLGGSTLLAFSLGGGWLGSRLWRSFG